ncbi:MAG: methylisocitrate lyase [Pirellulaceae bacterium]|nr:methylisocitrate lyase [Pirellulaceae bacterium]
MQDDISPGARFRLAVDHECPLQIVGAVNAMSAKIAEAAGFRCLYLSGAGVANASWGIPDLGMTTLDQVTEDARRITAASSLPLLVDCDTGWETTKSVAMTIQQMESVGVAAVHLEDQLEPKRCGHRPGKRLVSISQMSDRVKSAVDARSDADLVIMARTDAAADEGLDAAIDRACRYVDAGADMIFAEALVSWDEFQKFANDVSVPVLANMTEFGKSPLLTINQLRDAGIRMILYPLTAFRAMNAAAQRAYTTLRHEGTQAALLDAMQTRDELYDLLDYHRWEQEIDDRNGNGSNGNGSIDSDRQQPDGPSSSAPPTSENSS